jgi:metal-responsive CopG/Arc/MetJ family transcriptional regulator
MITKTKLTVTINQELLKEFNNICDKTAINKSKLITNMIKEWCKNNNK